MGRNALPASAFGTIPLPKPNNQPPPDRKNDFVQTVFDSPNNVAPSASSSSSSAQFTDQSCYARRQARHHSVVLNRPIANNQPPPDRKNDFVQTVFDSPNNVAPSASSSSSSAQFTDQSSYARRQARRHPVVLNRPIATPAKGVPTSNKFEPLDALIDVETPKLDAKTAAKTNNRGRNKTPQPEPQRPAAPSSLETKVAAGKALPTKLKNGLPDNIAHFDHRRIPIRTSFPCSDEAMRAVGLAFPGYSFSFAPRGPLHSHPVLALDRRLMEDECLKLTRLVDYSGEKIKAGGIVGDVGAGCRITNERIHAIRPNLCAADVGRNFDQRVNNTSHCDHTLQSCNCSDPEGFESLIFVHSIYYFNPESVAKALSKTQHKVAYAVAHVFDEPIGVMATYGNHTEAKWYIDSNDNVTFSVVGNNSPYIHPNASWLNVSVHHTTFGSLTIVAKMSSNFSTLYQLILTKLNIPLAPVPVGPMGEKRSFGPMTVSNLRLTTRHTCGSFNVFTNGNPDTIPVYVPSDMMTAAARYMIGRPRNAQTYHDLLAHMKSDFMRYKDRPWVSQLDVNTVIHAASQAAMLDVANATDHYNAMWTFATAFDRHNTAMTMSRAFNWFECVMFTLLVLAAAVLYNVADRDAPGKPYAFLLLLVPFCYTLYHYFNRLTVTSINDTTRNPRNNPGPPRVGPTNHTVMSITHNMEPRPPGETAKVFVPITPNLGKESVPNTVAVGVVTRVTPTVFTSNHDNEMNAITNRATHKIAVEPDKDVLAEFSLFVDSCIQAELFPHDIGPIMPTEEWINRFPPATQAILRREKANPTLNREEKQLYGLSAFTKTTCDVPHARPHPQRR